MAELQRLEIVTPHRVVFQEDVKFIIAPGSDGELGILPEHAPLVTTLDIGLIRVEWDGVSTGAGASAAVSAGAGAGTVASASVGARGGVNDNLKIAVSGGFMEVRDSRVVILAEAAEVSGEIDVDRAEAARKRAEERLSKPLPDMDVARAEMALKRALNRLASVK